MKSREAELEEFKRMRDADFEDFERRRVQEMETMGREKEAERYELEQIRAQLAKQNELYLKQNEALQELNQNRSIVDLEQRIIEILEKMGPQGLFGTQQAQEDKETTKKMRELEKLKRENERIKKFTQNFLDEEIDRRMNEYAGPQGVWLRNLELKRKLQGQVDQKKD